MQVTEQEIALPAFHWGLGLQSHPICHPVLPGYVCAPAHSASAELISELHRVTKASTATQRASKNRGESMSPRKKSRPVKTRAWANGRTADTDAGSCPGAAEERRGKEGPAGQRIFTSSTSGA